MREGWTIKVGNRDELERQRLKDWKAKTVSERLRLYDEFLATWKGNDARRLERVFRIPSQTQG